MKTALKHLSLLAAATFGFSIACFGQLQWSSYNNVGALVTASLASGGDATYGGSVTFTIPANTERIFMATNFATITLNTAGATEAVYFTLTASGGLSTGTLGRILGMGLFNDPGTFSNALDDQGYWCNFNTGNPSFEGFYRPNTVTTFFQYDGNHKPGSSTTKTGLPTDGQTYGVQFELVNVSNSGIGIGTSKTPYSAAGAYMTNISGTLGTVNQVGYWSSTPFTTLSVNSFNEFAVMFNNTTVNSVTVTLSGITLVPLNPGISTSPQPYSGSVGSTAAFTVAVNTNALTPLAFQWYETNASGVVALTDGLTPNGSYVTNSATASTLLFTNTLTFTNLQTLDSGNIFVVITNAYGAVTSAPVAMNIIAADSPPTNVVVTPPGATVITGQGTNFTASSIAAPTPTLYWFDNNNNLLQSGAGVTLALSSLQLANGGTYSVIASNYLGTASTNFTVTVIVPPCISQQPGSVLVNAGDPVNFSVVEGGCAVPAPAYQWYKNGNVISGATATSYSITSAALSDIAYYTVGISNSAGSVTSSGAKLAMYSTSMTGTPSLPANNAPGLCVDTYLSITFNQAPSVGNVGQIRIYDASNPSTPVDTIDMSQNNALGVQAHSLFAGDSQAFNYYPIMVAGYTATIYPHSGVLTTGKTYYVTIDPGVIVDPSLAYFPGISSSSTWQFTTKANGPANATNLVVVADGSGDFVTVQGAVDSIPLNNTNYTVINIRDGNYVEIVNISLKHNVTFRGQSRAGTIVGYPNNYYVAPGGTTHARMAFKVNANDIVIENMTITNSTPQGGGQAEALMIEGYNSATAARRFILNNATVASLQDTILANINSSQGYFYNSTVRGNFDYLWGGGNLFFSNCVFHTVTNTSGSSSYNLTAARTDFGTTSSTGNWMTPDGTKWSSNGFSLVSCTLEADPGVHGITLAGNNGTAGGQVDWIFCKIDPNAYIGPTATISNTFNLWQYSNTDLSLNPVTFSNVVTLGNSDPRLIAATNVTIWLNGWAPQLAPNILTSPANQSVAAGGTISLNVTATGIPDPAYQWLKNGSPLAGQTGASLSIAGAQAGDAGTYSVVVSNPAGVENSSGAIVTVGNTAPTLAGIADQTVNVGVTVSIDLAALASDPDVPPQTLTYSLVSGPGNASVDPGTGAFSFRPLASQAGATCPMTVSVADNGAGLLSASQSFNVIVNPLTQPDVNSVAWTAGQLGLTVSGELGPDYAVQASTDLASWNTVFRTNSPAMPFQWSDPDSGTFPARFYRILVGPPLP